MIKKNTLYRYRGMPRTHLFAQLIHMNRKQMELAPRHKSDRNTRLKHWAGAASRECVCGEVLTVYPVWDRLSCSPQCTPGTPHLTVGHSGCRCMLQHQLCGCWGSHLRFSGLHTSHSPTEPSPPINVFSSNCTPYFTFTHDIRYLTFLIRWA